MQHRLGAVDERRQRAPIRDACLSDHHTPELRAQVRKVTQLFCPRVGGIREVVDDEHVIAAREQSSRHMISDEADSPGDDDARHGTAVSVASPWKNGPVARRVPARRSPDTAGPHA
jgi:hypothetical protein